MKKSIKSIAMAAFAAASLSAGGSVLAEDMEKCKVVDKDGMGLIKANKADCAGKSHSCAGQNDSGDPEAWIYTTKMVCAKLNAGDFSGIDQEVLDKINTGS